ncbi:MAG: alpha/beta fold hydrolase [Chloroflexota bacterium]
MELKNNPAFVFVHGAWHNKETWIKVIERLEAKGYGGIAIDLPGAGEHAKIPQSFSNRPLDPAAFASEPSPNAGTTQEERNSAVRAAIEQAAALGNGKVVLVGHSLGGITLSPVTESIPEQLHAVVYVTAFMLPPGMMAVQMITHELMAAALVPKLFMADPEQVGALRWDVASPDPEYRFLAKAAFYADVPDDEIDEALSRLHCDEPVAVAAQPSNITPDKFGTVNRHYIKCVQDQAITLAGQEHMIALVDEAMGNGTIVHALDTSHSPFYSQPDALVDILLEAAS